MIAAQRSISRRTVRFDRTVFDYQRRCGDRIDFQRAHKEYLKIAAFLVGYHLAEPHRATPSPLYYVED